MQSTPVLGPPRNWPKQNDASPRIGEDGVSRCLGDETVPPHRKAANHRTSGRGQRATPINRPHEAVGEGTYVATALGTLKMPLPIMIPTSVPIAATGPSVRGRRPIGPFTIRPHGPGRGS